MVINKLTYRAHAIKRMFERAVSNEEVRHVLEHGDIIESYPDDLPYPSALLLGWCESRPLHVVAANNAEDNETIVITVYEPDPLLWENDFRTRKRREQP